MSGLVLLLGLCGIIAALGARLPGSGVDDNAPLEEIEVNAIGTSLNEPIAPVEEYMAAMAAFDAKRMWASYSPAVQAESASRGQTVAELQAGLDRARAGGARIESVSRVATYDLRDGRRYAFYIVRRAGFPPNGDPEELYFIFTVDRDGKILSVT